ncbi:MAG: thermonuclease family protein [Candidatus Pacearchaeota archaeon]|jgi:micrococcal nuclease
MKPYIIVIIAVIVLFGCFWGIIYILGDYDLSNPFSYNNSKTYNSENNYTSVIRVIDGDTLILLNDSGGVETVRLLCVDTPEQGSSGYEEAKNYLAYLVRLDDTNITLEREGLDVYNRTLAWVYVDGVLINKDLIDKGYGSVFAFNGTDCSRVM